MEINYNNYTKWKFCIALKTLKVFSLFNLKIDRGIKSLPVDRDRRTKRHKPILASHTAKTINIKINRNKFPNIKERFIKENKNKDKASKQSKIIKEWFNE